MRRSDRKQNLEFALQVLDHCQWAVISMVDPEGHPYAIPITIVREDLNIYIHCAPVGFKVDCLRHNPEICLTAVSYAQTDEANFTTIYESVVAHGTAVEITAADEKIRALRLLCERHTPNNLQNFAGAVSRSLNRTAIWKFNLTDINGKSNRKNAHTETNTNNRHQKEQDY